MDFQQIWLALTESPQRYEILITPVALTMIYIIMRLFAPQKKPIIAPLKDVLPFPERMETIYRNPPIRSATPSTNTKMASIEWITKLFTNGTLPYSASNKEVKECAAQYNKRIDNPGISRARSKLRMSLIRNLYSRCKNHQMSTEVLTLCKNLHDICNLNCTTHRWQDLSNQCLILHESLKDKADCKTAMDRFCSFINEEALAC